PLLAVVQFSSSVLGPNGTAQVPVIQARSVTFAGGPAAIAVPATKVRARVEIRRLNRTGWLSLWMVPKGGWWRDCPGPGGIGQRGLAVRFQNAPCRIYYPVDGQTQESDHAEVPGESQGQGQGQGRPLTIAVDASRRRARPGGSGCGLAAGARRHRRGGGAGAQGRRRASGSLSRAAGRQTPVARVAAVRSRATDSIPAGPFPHARQTSRGRHRGDCRLPRSPDRGPGGGRAFLDSERSPSS